MKKVVDLALRFIKELIILAISGVTAYFAMLGAVETLKDKPFFSELGDTSTALGFIYFFAVLVLVDIGITHFKEATAKNGKKK